MSQAVIHHTTTPVSLAFSPWALRAWPPVLWQASVTTPVRFKHVGTRIACPGDPFYPPAGQTIWAAHASDGEAGMAWDWIQIARGVVAIADPMSVVTNLRFVGGEGQVLTAHESALFLNEILRTLPWQNEVHRVLDEFND